MRLCRGHEAFLRLIVTALTPVAGSLAFPLRPTSLLHLSSCSVYLQAPACAAEVPRPPASSSSSQDRQHRRSETSASRCPFQSAGLKQEGPVTFSAPRNPEAAATASER